MCSANLLFPGPYWKKNNKPNHNTHTINKKTKNRWKNEAVWSFGGSFPSKKECHKTRPDRCKLYWREAPAEEYIHDNGSWQTDRCDFQARRFTSQFQMLPNFNSLLSSCSLLSDVIGHVSPLNTNPHITSVNDLLYYPAIASIISLLPYSSSLLCALSCVDDVFKPCQHAASDCWL